MPNGPELHELAWLLVPDHFQRLMFPSDNGARPHPGSVQLVSYVPRRRAVVTFQERSPQEVTGRRYRAVLIAADHAKRVVENFSAIVEHHGRGELSFNVPRVLRHQASCHTLLMSELPGSSSPTEWGSSTAAC